MLFMDFKEAFDRTWHAAPRSTMKLYNINPNFNIFLERIMTGALEDHERSVSIVGRTITILRFPDNIDALAGKKEEFTQPTGHSINNIWHGDQRRKD